MYISRKKRLEKEYVIWKERLRSIPSSFSKMSTLKTFDNEMV